MRKVDGEESLARRMRAAAKDAKLTQRQIAEQMPTTEHTISMWWNGRLKPNSVNLRRYAEVCGTTAGRLEGEEPEAALAARWLLAVARRMAQGTDPFVEFAGKYGDEHISQEAKDELLAILPMITERWAHFRETLSKEMAEELLIGIVEAATGVRLRPPGNGDHA